MTWKQANDLKSGDVITWAGAKYVVAANAVHLESAVTMVICVDGRSLNVLRSVYGLRLLRGTPVEVTSTMFVPLTVIDHPDGSVDPDLVAATEILMNKKSPPQFVTLAGRRTALTDPERGVWYGQCGFWTDDWAALVKIGPGIPACPKCKVPGFQTTAKEWEANARTHEANGNAGYMNFLLLHRERCYRHVEKGLTGVWEAARERASGAERLNAAIMDGLTRPTVPPLDTVLLPTLLPGGPDGESPIPPASEAPSDAGTSVPTQSDAPAPPDSGGPSDNGGGSDGGGGGGGDGGGE
jgi:hypothetical protein